MMFASLNAQIVINEINYKDAIDFETKDWVELYNNGNSSVDISNWVFKDDDDLHEFVIPNGTFMQPHSYLVLAQFLSDFQSLYPNVSPVLGDFEFGFSGGGEIVRLFDGSDNLIDFVEYDDVEPWPTEPDGNGPTLELKNPNLDNALASSWAASVAPNGLHGTPGEENSTNILAVNNYNNLKVIVSPNPLITSTTISIPNWTSSLSLSVYDMLGRVVKTMKSNSNSILLDKENLSSGMYILKIATKNGSFESTKKLIVK